MVRDQTVAGTWHSLGSFAFAPGAGHGVDLPDLDEDVLVADAIQFRPAGAAPVAATWTPAIPAAGLYRLAAQWPAATDRTTAATCTVTLAAGTTQVVRDQ